MAFFATGSQFRTLFANNDGNNTGALAFVLGVNAPAAGKDIELSDALTNTSLAGIFVFCPQALNFKRRC
ncbi:hypothetical protein [Pectobacterium brasiliense]|uniref:hypothetical protein n=1 Tax=Pectobacterium brasiliense TaxID=180957 RepID=UPI00196934BC|nr:hypothetical protein [Pectobacterium brasiliense]MBN3121895.1 hypothetical protein [Pectobacterium brasiliense]